jgi:hypothetical protein
MENQDIALELSNKIVTDITKRLSLWNKLVYRSDRATNDGPIAEPKINYNLPINYWLELKFKSETPINLTNRLWYILSEYKYYDDKFRYIEIKNDLEFYRVSSNIITITVIRNPKVMFPTGFVTLILRYLTPHMPINWELLIEDEE